MSIFPALVQSKARGGEVLIKARLVGEAATSESSKCWPIPLIWRIPTVAYHILTSMTQYFDKSGTYKAYTTDGKHLFNEAKEQIGSFVNGFLYDNQGRAIGHVKGKLILDKSGQPLYYTN